MVTWNGRSTPSFSVSVRTAAGSILALPLQNENATTRIARVGRRCEFVCPNSLMMDNDLKNFNTLAFQTPVMATDAPRCSYCVDGDGFRRLTRYYGDPPICTSYLHLSSSLDQSSSANAPNCRKYQRPSEAVAGQELSASIASLDRGIQSRKSRSRRKATDRRHA